MIEAILTAVSEAQVNIDEYLTLWTDRQILQLRYLAEERAEKVKERHRVMGINSRVLNTVKVLKDRIRFVERRADGYWVEIDRVGERIIEDAVAAGLVGEGVPLVKRE